jgi:hypothetical protein
MVLDVKEVERTAKAIQEMYADTDILEFADASLKLISLYEDLEYRYIDLRAFTEEELGKIKATVDIMIRDVNETFPKQKE